MNKKRPPWQVAILAILTACLLCLLASFALQALGLLPAATTAIRQPTSTSLPPPTSTPDPAQTYLLQYGGNLEVYIEIFTLTDCAILQQKFDIAAGNNDRAEPGTPEFKWTLGYMLASDERMKTIGCY